MGGDNAPDVVVKGALDALGELDPQSRIVLFGDRAAIEAVLASDGRTSDRISIVPTGEVIEMGDHPAKAYQQKEDSSIKVGFNYLKEGYIQGFASAGSTGAMLVGCMYSAENIRNVIRPAISAKISTLDGSDVLVLDVGINVDCKPDVLYQYGLIGSVFSREVLGKPNPRVALLNIGEEKEKGNLATKAAHELMSETDKYNFVGNVEARDILTGKVADVVVCDGFVGNTVLKQLEGVYQIFTGRGIRDAYLDKLNYEYAGGTPVLGINSIVIIGHGCSSALAIKNMIIQTEAAVKSGLVDKLKAIFDKL